MGTNEDALGRLRRLRGSRTVIVGIGNTLRADDGAGVLLCEKLTGRIAADVIDAGTAPENYISRITEKAPENLIVVDAIDFGARPGTVRVFELEQLKSQAISTHSLSPRLFADLVRRRVRVEVYFVGIQPGCLEIGAGVSPEVGRAVTLLCETFTDIFSADMPGE